MFVITCTSNVNGGDLNGRTFPLHKNGRQPAIVLDTDPPKLIAREKTALKQAALLAWPGWSFDVRPATASEIAKGSATPGHKLHNSKATSTKRRTPYVISKRSRRLPK
jgi:hypothetical protein